MITQFVNKGTDLEVLNKSYESMPLEQQEELAKALKKDGLVLVDVQVNGKHGTYTRKQWKKASDVKKNEGFKKYVDKKQKIEDLEFKRLPDEQLSSEDYRKKYEKEINGFLLHHMNNYRSYDETFLRKEYMEKGIYNEETEAEIQNLLNIIEEENRKSDQEFFDKQEEIYNESPIDSMEWHYPISEV